MDNYCVRILNPSNRNQSKRYILLEYAMTLRNWTPSITYVIALDSARRRASITTDCVHLFSWRRLNKCTPFYLSTILPCNMSDQALANSIDQIRNILIGVAFHASCILDSLLENLDATGHNRTATFNRNACSTADTDSWIFTHLTSHYDIWAGLAIGVRTIKGNYSIEAAHTSEANSFVIAGAAAIVNDYAAFYTNFATCQYNMHVRLA